MRKPSGRAGAGRQIYDELRNNVIRESWKPGEKIPQAVDLARELGTQGYIVRRALKRLVALGLLERKANDEMYVRPLYDGVYAGSVFPHLAYEQTTILQILEYRWIVERGSASLAARKADENDIAELERAFRKMEASQNDPDLVAKYDLEFHIVLAKATHNPVIVRVITSLKAKLEATIMQLTNCLGINDGIFYHEQILQAVRNHDRERAEKWMEEHIARTIRRYVRKTNPDGMEE